MVDNTEVGRVEIRAGTKGKVLASLTRTDKYWILRADGETTLRFDYEEGLRALLASISDREGKARETATSTAGTASPATQPERSSAPRKPLVATSQCQ